MGPTDRTRPATAGAVVTDGCGPSGWCRTYSTLVISLKTSSVTGLGVSPEMPALSAIAGSGCT